MNREWKIGLAVLVSFALLGTVRPSLAQDTPAPKATTLWVDQKTGQVFVRPGRGRVAGVALGANPV